MSKWQSVVATTLAGAIVLSAGILGVQVANLVTQVEAVLKLFGL
jgi:hypothetical protein